jgi:hypothetical protein
MTDIFSTLNTTEYAEFTFIAGTNQTLTFDMYDASSSPIDIGNGMSAWAMSPYGQPQNATLILAGTNSGSSISYRFTVPISGSLTQSLSGKYIHQPVYFDAQGMEYRPGQGSILIRSKNTTI